MEKTVKFTTGELIKWGSIIAMVISSFLSLQYKVNNCEKRIDQQDKEIKDLKECQQATAREVANVNGKLDIIINYVQTINESITDNSISPRR